MKYYCPVYKCTTQTKDTCRKRIEAKKEVKLRKNKGVALTVDTYPDCLKCDGKMLREID